jgi:hypothetical protein
MMRRHLVGTAVAVAALASASGAFAHLDHPVPSFSEPAPLSTQVNAGGENAAWELVTTIATGNAHTDLDFFTHKGDTYASVGTLAAGPNAGGQTLVRLTEGGEVKPSYVTGHPSASCLTTTQSATGLQHDVEATPKGGALPQQINPAIVTTDAQLVLDATDAGGRCHDQGTLGQSSPQGGIEIIDITDPAAPKEIGLTNHISQCHTVNVDPKRPHIAFCIGQDGININADGTRTNDTTGNQLDGFEVLDLSSCMNFPAGTSIEAKRAACRPQVYRHRYESVNVARSHTYDSAQSCHESEIYPDDTLVCASIDATVLFDLSGAFDDRGTPANFADDRLKGTPLPCRVRDTSTTAPAFSTGAKVTDCVNGERAGQPQPLQVVEWLKIGSPSLDGVRWVGTVPHMGFKTGATDTIVTGPHDATVDLVAAHESEISQSGRFVFTSDERGGGTVPVGASCDAGGANVRGNGGIHAFRIEGFKRERYANAEAAWTAWAKNSQGQKSIFRAPTRTGAAPDFCTSHVFQQIPGQNRIFMGYYTQGTQVVDYVENADGTLDFKEAGYFVPENANTWVSHVFKVQRNQDGTYTYWGATGDGILPATGRGAIDIYKVTLPAPPEPRYLPGKQAGAPKFPTSVVKGVDNASKQLPACARTAAFERVSVTPKGRGLRFAFNHRGGAPVSIDLFQQSSGRRVTGERLARRFGVRTSSYTWNGRGAKGGDGVYFARLRAKAPNGKTDTRRVALERRRGTWRVLPDFDRRTACELVDAFKLERPVFGGRTNGALGIAFRLGESARVTVELRRGSKVVKRFKAKAYAPNRAHRLRVPARGIARGTYTVVLKASRPGREGTQVLTARRL